MLHAIKQDEGRAVSAGLCPVFVWRFPLGEPVPWRGRLGESLRKNAMREMSSHTLLKQSASVRRIPRNRGRRFPKQSTLIVPPEPPQCQAVSAKAYYSEGVAKLGFDGIRCCANGIQRRNDPSVTAYAVPAPLTGEPFSAPSNADLYALNLPVSCRFSTCAFGKVGVY